MASPVLGSQDTCSECGATLSDIMRHCPTCRADAGAPNVRFCRTDENLQALEARVDTARSQVNESGCLDEFKDLETLIKQKSGVVITMPTGMARKLFEDPKCLYKNYGDLVGAGVRKPASLDNDRQRCAVGGLLFGSCANAIICGALSLTEKGLPTYGTVYCRLHSVAINKRTSFLETNSYKFVQDHRIVPGDKLPVGYMACWKYRHSLVLAKLASLLSTGQTESDWQAILIQSDGKNRENDNFVEAHIYEGFDKNAIKSLTPIPDKRLRREEKLDLRIAVSMFKSHMEQNK